MAYGNIHDQFGHLTDDQLIEAALAMREKAGIAPNAELSMENKNGEPTGHKFIYSHTDAWARFSREWCQMMDEIERRKKSQEMSRDRPRSRSPSEGTSLVTTPPLAHTEALDTEGFKPDICQPAGAACDKQNPLGKTPRGFGGHCW